MRSLCVMTILFLGTVAQATETIESVPPPAVAEESAAAERPDATLSLTGSYLVSVTSVGTIRVDADGDGMADAGEAYGQDLLMPHRLRFEPKATFHDSLSLEADFQLLSGYLTVDEPDARFVGFGAPRDSSADAFSKTMVWRDQFKLRKLMIRWRTPAGMVIAGRMASQWGSGLLANGGDNDLQDWGGTRFGEDRNYGDVVNRIVFATKPLHLATDAEWANRWILAVGADVLERDERTNLSEGDFAWEGIGALRYQHEGQEVGIYVAYRDLEDRNDDTLNVWAVDLFGEGSHRFADVEVSGLAEVVFVTGETTLARNNAFTGIIDVQQLGYIARAGATYLPLGLGGDVEVGYASGDSNPNDGNLRDFKFDTDYNPSLILFEELRAAETVAAAANASDPERVGIPADAVRLLPSNGAVSNTIYVRPTLRASSKTFLPPNLGEVGLRIAMMYAVAEEDMVDPYASNLNGGVAVNHQGGDGGEHELGLEFDVGVDYGIQIDRWVKLDASLQYGRLLPGAAFKNASGLDHPSIDVFFARLMVRWLPPDPPAGA
jgi:hypothetical protein